MVIIKLNVTYIYSVIPEFGAADNVDNDDVTTVGNVVIATGAKYKILILYICVYMYNIAH